MKKHLKDYFIPHEGNDYKPHSLQKAAMFAMFFLVFLSFVLTNLHSLLWTSSDWLISTVLPAVIVDLTNEEREEESLVELKRNATLDAAAALKAQHMAQNEYFSHYSPDGVSPWHWFNQADYNFVHAGENLAIHFTDSSDVVEAWMDSPTHRANILNGDYREIGVGTAEGTYEGFSTVYVVQLFGTPAAASALAATETADPVREPAVAGTEIAALPVNQSEETEVLAESVEIIENIEVVTNELGDLVDSVEVIELPDNSTVKEDSADLQVAEVSYENDSVVVYSDHISTSTGAVPASIDSNEAVKDNSNWFHSVVTQPHLVLQILYALIALFVLVSLTLAIVIEIKRQNPVQVAYSVALLLLMYGLYSLHTVLTTGVIVV